MKLIHLSDLHLGKRVNDISMLDDQKYILEQILHILDAEQPDAVWKNQKQHAQRKSSVWTGFPKN